ncbi:PQQ-binding-like beta-propeller repeat protein [Embleya sp. NBC_00896]|uniref:outer membrane protein assembly factor BamB family protein n=1 Tax=Embleya sp. NBC_00896 TaxID=2975961 RepID=UPI0038631D20|nr:PQQ-binding-like beta-propeller repeat protein [Embleya sp. NBC_00896]
MLDHDGPLSEGPLREVAAGIADALARVHAIGLVHGRLGPDQVLITPYGPRVTGFAGRTDDEGGDPSEDVYAFATLITLAGGGTSSAELRPLLRRCLDPDPRQRPTAVDVDRVLSPRPYVLVLPRSTEPVADVPQEAKAQDPPTGRGLTRRRLLVAGGVALTAATVTSAGIAFARRSDDGYGQPDIRWRRAVEGRVTTLQVFDNVGYLSGTENVIKAVGTDTGVALWTSRTDSMVWSEPVVSGAAVFVTCVAGQVYALDPRTGEQTWQYTADNQIIGSPLLSGTSLVFGTIDNRIIALDMTQGGQRWMWSDGAQRGGVMPASTGVGADFLYLVYADGTVSAFHPASRTVPWTIRLAAPIARAARAVGDLVYVVTGLTLVALDARTGDILWRFRGTPDLSVPVVGKELVYTTDIGTLYALDPRTGVERWRQTTGATVPSPVAVVDGVAYAGGEDELHAFDRLTGKRRWSYPVSTYLTAAPAGAKGVLLLGTAGSELVALEV